MWRRRLLAAATAASLLLATALAAVYVRSFFARDELTVAVADRRQCGARVDAPASPALP